MFRNNASLSRMHTRKTKHIYGVRERGKKNLNKITAKKSRFVVKRKIMFRLGIDL